MGDCKQQMFGYLSQKSEALSNLNQYLVFPQLVRDIDRKHNSGIQELDKASKKLASIL